MDKKNLKIIASLLVLVILIGVYIFGKQNKKEDVSATYYYLGTVNDIKILKDNKKHSEEILKKSEKILIDVHNKMSSQLSNTEVDKVNKNAGIKPVKVSEETFYVMENALKYAGLTEGVFDPSIGAISSLWNIGNEEARVPKNEEIKDNLKFVNYKNVLLNKKQNTIFLKEKGMKIDLGAIAKGYAADRIANLMKDEKISSAIINLGGNVYVVGKKDDSNFKIGIQAPYEKKSEAIGYIKGSDISVVTSGTYERYIKDGDKIYHHMMDPKTGYPFDNNLNSVSIISKVSMDGDALSTSTYGLGIEKGKIFIENQKNIEAIFVTKDKKIILTKGLKNNFVLTDDTYEIIK